MQENKKVVILNKQTVDKLNQNINHQNASYNFIIVNIKIKSVDK